MKNNSKKSKNKNKKQKRVSSWGRIDEPKRTNFCGAVKTKDEKPIKIIRGIAGKISCTKQGGICPNCSIISRT